MVNPEFNYHKAVHFLHLMETRQAPCVSPIGGWIVRPERFHSRFRFRGGVAKLNIHS
jgi:hypothetical protein